MPIDLAIFIEKWLICLFQVFCECNITPETITDTYKILHTSCYIQTSTYELLHSKYYIQIDIYRILHTNCYIQNATYNCYSQRLLVDTTITQIKYNRILLVITTQYLI